MPFRKEIIYPVFLECCQYTPDIFWENIFTDLAYGKPPYGTYITKGFLCCTHKKKDFSYKIENNKNSNELFNEIYSILTTKVGILSQNDKIKKRKLFNEVEVNLKQNLQDWNSIRKKNIKELMIELYVTRMKDKYSLSIKQARFLLSIIFTALIFKVITSQDIIYEDSKIKEIKGIDFINKKLIIEKDLYNLKIDFSLEVIKDKSLMSETWDRYIKDLKKLSNK